MPYRIDIRDPGHEAFERLVALGALDVDSVPGAAVAAVMPDGVSVEQVAYGLGIDPGAIVVSLAHARDDGSVWVLNPRPVQIGRIRIAPADTPARAGTIRLADSPAFGSGLHPTTAMCLELLDNSMTDATPSPSVLDVGTGSGILALVALMLGARHAVGMDIGADALAAAAENARLNGVEDRFQLVLGGPDAIAGTWPLVLANVLAAPLIEMAPALAQRVGHHGQLVLSGIPTALEHEVERAYRHRGMRRVGATSRGGWVALLLQASW